MIPIWFLPVCFEKGFFEECSEGLIRAMMSNLCSPRRCSVPPSLCLKSSIRGMLGRLIRAMKNYSCSPRRCSGRLYWRNSLSNASVQLCCVFVLVIQGLLLVVVILVGIALIKFAHGIVRGQISKSLAVRYVRDLREVIQRARTTVGAVELRVWQRRMPTMEGQSVHRATWPGNPGELRTDFANLGFRDLG